MCKIRVIRRALSANADVLALGQAGFDGLRNQGRDRRITFVKISSQQLHARITVQTQCELGQVIGANRKAVKKLKELLSQNGIAGHFTHHDDLEIVFATAQALAGQALRHVKVEDGPGRPLGRHFRVKLWPTLILLQDGQEIARTVRPTQAEAVQTLLQTPSA